MKKIARIAAEFESPLSESELKEKIAKTIEEQELEDNRPEKSRQYFFWEDNKGEYRLRFYHSFKNDMCDTAFHGIISKGLEGCRLEGFFKKPAGVWGVFWAIMGVTFAIALAFFLSVFLSEEPELGMIPIFLAVLVPVAFIEVNLLMFDKKRIKTVNGYLREFTAAENTDVLGEELAEDQRD